MNELKKKLIERIKKEGPISFQSLMEMCLYFPELGYYVKETTTIGKKGDYYTSPHLHPVFGAFLAVQLEEMWERLGKPTNFTVLEIGPGMGYLCRDILDFLVKKNSPLLKSLLYKLMELNPSLKVGQKALLKDYQGVVSWLDRLEEVVYGCVLAHEVLDAFPVHLVEKRASGLKEIYITFDGNELKEILMDAKDELINYFKTRGITLPLHYRTEVNLAMKHWIKTISDFLVKEGFVWIIDYGYTSKEYFHAERNRGTIMSYYNHKASENYLDHLGDQDITAHVNFSDLKSWGDEAGFTTIGFCGQGTFLLALDTDKVMRMFFNGSENLMHHTLKIKSLFLGIGESHSVTVLYKGGNAFQLKGFSMRNQVNLL